MSRYNWPDVPRAEERDDPGARARFVTRRRTDFDLEGARIAGRQLPARLPGHPFGAPAVGRQFLWQPLGPMTVVAGQATGTPRIAGRVNAIAVESGGNRIYAASGTGGLWYSSDAGANWRSLGGFAPTNTVGITRPAQRNACGTVFVNFGATEADDDVFIGTGETAGFPDAQPGSSMGGLGILFAHGPATSAADDPWTREAKNLIGRGINAIVRDPGGTTTIAATTIGLLQRPAAPAADADWTPVAGTPFNTLTDEITHALWTAAAGARPARLWVWVRNGASAGLWVRATGETNFTQIATAGSKKRRAVLAASTPPDQIFVLNDAGKNVPPNLYRVAAASAALPVATAVTAGVPNVLEAQGFYDIAMVVHPTMPNRIVIGGCSFDATMPDGTVLNDGAILMADVADNAGTLTFGYPNAPTPLGVGVHSDVHAVAYSNGGNRLWATCDGGVFRSDQPTKNVGFVPCNNGLSIIESNYIASHPTCEGHVVTGLQDNGVITRLSSSVWRHVGDGDGGGVVFDPIRPDRFLREHFQGYWSSSDGSVAAAALLTRAGTFAQAEFDVASFYSEAAAIPNRRGTPAPAAPNVGQIILGTDRVWYTENFGASWVTLPTGNDPLPANTNQDSVGQAITVCRWQSPEVAWVLGQSTLQRYSRTAGSDSGGGPGTWTAVPVMPGVVIAPPAPGSPPPSTGKAKKRSPPAAPPPPPSMLDAKVWTDVAVNLDPPPGAGQPPAQHGPVGAVYVGTVGDPDKSNVDTLWWFNGTDTWYPTNLRSDANGVPAPVTAIVCDAAFPMEVWVGTTVGVWFGVRTDHGASAPTWEWHSRVNGLPEASVEDLAIFSDGGIRLLRAGIAARGVWELRLDTPDVADLTYVRAHDDDLRYRARAVETKRDLTTPRSWHGSPDVRPRRASLPRTAPTSLPWTQPSPHIDAEALRRFQSALRSKTSDPRVRATGAWDSYFNEVLRDLGAPIQPPPASKVVGIDKTFWNATMIAPHASADPWGAGIPSEADLYELSATLVEGDVTATSCTLPAQKLKVDIVVHHRGLDTVSGDDVRVTLLRWSDTKTKHAAKWNDQTTWFGGNVGWTPAVNEVLNSADGKTAQPVDGGWKFVLGTSTQSHRVTLPGQTLDSTHSGIATFDLDLTGAKQNTVVLLVAIIRVGTTPADDIALAPATLQDLALTSSNVAVRSLRVGR
ncbi:MAG TPA: hypothetical protein VF785_22435 [Gemmatimonadaceae bacterium]